MSAAERVHFSSDVHFLQRDGTTADDRFRIAYRLHGGGRSKVLLLGSLHSTSASWRGNIEQWLSGDGGLDLQLLTVDNRGSGDSGMPHNAARFTTAEMARDVLEVLYALGWTDVHIVGPSLGGMIATELMLLLDVSKVRVCSLVLVNTTDGSLLRNFPSWRIFATAVEGVWRQAVTGHTRAYAAKQVGLAFSDQFLRTTSGDGTPIREALIDDLVASCTLQGPPGATQQVYAVLTHAMRADRMRQLRHRLHCEMHTRLGVFVSELDAVIRPRCSYALRDALQPHEFVVFAQCGHNVAVEQRDRFCDALRQLWREAESATGSDSTTECRVSGCPNLSKSTRTGALASLLLSRGVACTSLAVIALVGAVIARNRLA